MIPGYIIECEIFLDYSAENIIALLSEGSKRGFHYFKIDYNNTEPKSLQEFSVEQATEAALGSIPAYSYNSIIVQKDDIYFFLHFQVNMYMKLTVSNFINPKYKEFENGLFRDLDMGIYLKTFFLLIDDYRIENLDLKKIY
jgi:hypothetical protein